MFSRASPRTSEHLRTHHLVNAYELSKLAVHAAQLGRHVIAMGDFNAVPDQLPIELIRTQTGMKDTWATVHPPVGVGEEDLPDSAESAVRDYGITAASALNTYSEPHPGGYVKKHKGKRLDYVFFRPPLRPGEGSGANMLEAAEARVVFTEHVPGRKHSFSDHFGLAATFRIVPRNDSDPLPSLGSAYMDNVDTQDTIPSPEPKISTSISDPPGVPPEMVDVMVGMLSRAYYHSVARHQSYLFVSLTCLGLLVLIVIGESGIHPGRTTASNALGRLNVSPARPLQHRARNAYGLLELGGDDHAVYRLRVRSLGGQCVDQRCGGAADSQGGAGADLMSREDCSRCCDGLLLMSGRLLYRYAYPTVISLE